MRFSLRRPRVSPVDFRGAMRLPVVKRDLTAVPSFSGALTSGGRAQIQLPLREGETALRYHQVMITFAHASMTLASIEAIRVKLNGENIWELSLTQLDLISRFDKRAALTATGDTLTLDFERMALENPAARFSTAINGAAPTLASLLAQAGIDRVGRSGQSLNPVSDFTIELQGAAGAPAITLSARAIVSNANPWQGSAIIRRRRIDWVVGATGEQALNIELTQPTQDRWLNRLYIFATSAQMTAARLMVDNRVRHQRTATENSKIQSDIGIRAPQTGLYVLDFTEHGHHENPILARGQGAIQLYATFGSTGTYSIIVETLGRVTS